MASYIYGAPSKAFPIAHEATYWPSIFDGTNLHKGPSLFTRMALRAFKKGARLCLFESRESLGTGDDGTFC